MAELVPLRLDLLLKRIFWEYEHEGKIFDLPKNKFFRGDTSLDTAVVFHGYRASTPVGPAAGPHDQMVQNIVLAWLAGSRIIELKTVQIMDELKIPRPCIDVHNVGYNVEWSQELKLELSLREYVGAAMALEIIKASGLLGEEFPASKRETILDMSVGYSLEGISSPRVRQWIESMKDARAIIDELRGCLTGSLARYRDLDFPTKISDTITLSTFHGCPADEIERICHFLLTEMDVHVCIKMNPTLLGRPVVEHLLHNVLGYQEIRTTQESFDKDLQFPDALEIVRRLDDVAHARGKRLAVKFSNTLVVLNHGSFFTDEVMYLSGQPLHVITLNLVKKFRNEFGASIPISFSAGVDAKNFSNMVALDFAPITTCTDLLRTGGYARLIRYLDHLEAKMRELSTPTRTEFVLRYRGLGQQAIRKVLADFRSSVEVHAGELLPAQLTAARNWLASAESRLNAWWHTGEPRLREVARGVAQEFDRSAGRQLPELIAAPLAEKVNQLEPLLAAEAGVLNTAPIVEEATADPRYRAEQNRGVPRKIGSHLYLYDCINCDKCVPICPNDANFIYETEPTEISYSNYRIQDGQLVETLGGVLKITKAHQIGNYADFCNDCGNCDVYCPEDGGPQIEKPRLFSNRKTYEAAGAQGFLVEYDGAKRAIYGTLNGKSYRVVIDEDHASFDDGVVEVDFDGRTQRILRWRAKAEARSEGHTIDLLPYLQLKHLLKAVSDPQRINYVNVQTV